DAVERARSFALPLRRLAGAEEQRRVIERREDGRAGRGIDDAQADALVGIARLATQGRERGQNIGAAVVQHRRAAGPITALMRNEAGYQAASAVEAMRVTRLMQLRLGARVAVELARKIIVEPAAIQIF